MAHREVTLVVDDEQRQARATFEHADYPEPYEIWIVHVPDEFVEHGELSYYIDDSSDADNPRFAAWSQAVEALAKLVADQLLIDFDYRNVG